MNARVIFRCVSYTFVVESAEEGEKSCDSGVGFAVRLCIELQCWRCYWHPVSSLKNAQSQSYFNCHLDFGHVTHFWIFLVCFDYQCNICLFPVSDTRQSLNCEQIGWADCKFNTTFFDQIL